jgi:hypothetical protein
MLASQTQQHRIDMILGQHNLLPLAATPKLLDNSNSQEGQKHRMDKDLDSSSKTKKLQVSFPSSRVWKHKNQKLLPGGVRKKKCSFVRSFSF